MKKYGYKIIFIILFILLGGFFIYHIKFQIQSEGSQIVVSESELCPGIKNIYERGMFDNEIQKCTSDHGEKYFMIQRFGIEGGSGRDFFDLIGNQIGSISQYGAGDGTIPKNATISGKTFSGSCVMVDLQDCGIIDLTTSYRGKKGLLKDSEYAKTCKNTIKKLGLTPPEVYNNEFFTLENRYYMCTDDKQVFYIGFTGNKIGENRSEIYKNYDTIQFFSIIGETLGISKNFNFKVGGYPFRGINLKESVSNISSINRCIPMPIYDCHYK